MTDDGEMSAAVAISGLEPVALALNSGSSRVSNPIFFGMIRTVAVAARDRARLAEILQIASRFGLGLLLSRLGMERAADDHGEPETLPRRTRLAIEALGPTFVKLGQILATRGDLLPPEWIAELEALHSRAPTLPFEALRGEVEAALGEPPETAFAHFDAQPLAAASMAQVHRATLHDGTDVVLKIRRPDIRPRIEADLRLIAQFATLVEGASLEARRFAPAALMRQLAVAILEELDFTGEGRNADRLRADFEGDSRIVIPRVHWQWTSGTLLVLDYVEGIAPRDAATLAAAGIDPNAIADLGADMVLDMVLVNGRFHADPHPGNLLCLSGDRLALLDLGMIGHVSPRRREEFMSFVQAFDRVDPAQLADVLALWSAGSGVSREVVLAAADALIARHSSGPLVLRMLIGDFMALMRENGMALPPDLLLLFKALITLDGVLSAIQPDFNLMAAVRRSSVRIVMARLDPARWASTLSALAWELARIGEDAPRLVRAAIRKLEMEPAARIGAPSQERPLLAAARWIAASILIAGALIAAALWGGR